MKPEGSSKITMPYRNLGNTGLRVSALSLGTNGTFGNPVSEETAERIAVFAYENGINLFETCESYANGAAEVTLGKILRRRKWRRSSYIISARICNSGDAATEQGLSRKHIVEGLRASLERLQLDYVDILIVTKPTDIPNPIEEVVRTCTYLIQMGWAFYWGTSHWTAAEIMQAQSVARQFNLIPSALDQSEYNMLQRDRVQYIQEACMKLNLGLVTTAPLADGLLTNSRVEILSAITGSSVNGQEEQHVDLVPRSNCAEYLEQLQKLTDLARRIHANCEQLAIAWCLRTPYVSSVVLEAASIEQLQDNMESLEVAVRLNMGVMSEIECILAPETTEGFL